MNTKRQTIWLVSMLSLMVVLSAYYLFTEDTSAPTKETKDHVRMEQSLEDDATKVGQMPEISVTEVSTGHEADPSSNGKDDTAPTQGNDSKSEEAGTSSTGAKEKGDGAATSATSTTQEDKEKDVLNKVEAEGVMKRSTIEELQMKRAENYQQEMERMMGEMNTESGEKTATVYDEMNKFDDHEQKIANLETELQKQYKNAVITQNSDKYQILVQSDKMVAKEAVEIVDKVMKDLHVTQDKITVEYVHE